MSASLSQRSSSASGWASCRDVFGPVLFLTVQIMFDSQLSHERPRQLAKDGLYRELS